MSFVFVKRKYGGTKVGKAIVISEDNKATIKQETGVDVTIEDNGFVVVPHDGGYKLAKVGDVFVSYTSEEGKSDSDVIDSAEYNTMFEKVSALKKPNPAGLDKDSAGIVSKPALEVSPVITFTETGSVNASLNEDNNDTGHTFTLGTITYDGEATGDFTLALSDESLTTYKVKLKTTTIARSNRVAVEAILQRARKNQKDAVSHSCPMTLTIDGKEFKFNTQVEIASVPQV